MSRLPFSDGVYDKTVQVGGCKHPVGDPKCGECWAGFPKVCQCHGLVHAQFVKEQWNSEKVIEYSCDNCGADYKILAHKPKGHNAKRRPEGRRRFM